MTIAGFILVAPACRYEQLSFRPDLKAFWRLLTEY